MLVVYHRNFKILYKYNTQNKNKERSTENLLRCFVINIFFSRYIRMMPMIKWWSFINYLPVMTLMTVCECVLWWVSGVCGGVKGRVLGVISLKCGLLQTPTDKTHTDWVDNKYKLGFKNDDSIINQFSFCTILSHFDTLKRVLDWVEVSRERRERERVRKEELKWNDSFCVVFALVSKVTTTKSIMKCWN